MLVSHELRTKAREEFVDITRTVEEDVRSSGLKEGLCVVYVPHTTAAVTINEDADPSVKEDILRQLMLSGPLDLCLLGSIIGTNNSTIYWSL